MVLQLDIEIWNTEFRRVNCTAPPTWHRCSLEHIALPWSTQIASQCNAMCVLWLLICFFQPSHHSQMRFDGGIFAHSSYAHMVRTTSVSSPDTGMHAGTVSAEWQTSLSQLALTEFDSDETQLAVQLHITIGDNQPSASFVYPSRVYSRLVVIS